MQKIEKASRAKLFLSFDSLKGFRSYLKKKERILVEEKELSQDTLDLLNYKIQHIEKNEIVKIVYYDKNEYVQIEGMIAKIDLEHKRIIQIVNTIIDIDRIISIESKKLSNLEL